MDTRKIIIYLVLLGAALAIVFLPGFFELKRLRQENIEYQKRIRLLEENNNQLTEELVKLEEDPGYLEKKAREKLGIVKKGEIIYRKTGVE